MFSKTIFHGTYLGLDKRICGQQFICSTTGYLSTCHYMRNVTGDNQRLIRIMRSPKLEAVQLVILTHDKFDWRSLCCSGLNLADKDHQCGASEYFSSDYIVTTAYTFGAVKLKRVVYF